MACKAGQEQRGTIDDGEWNAVAICRLSNHPEVTRVLIDGKSTEIRIRVLGQVNMAN